MDVLAVVEMRKQRTNGNFSTAGTESTEPVDLAEDTKRHPQMSADLRR
jgi:hypothetical protein